ncbi:MAG: M23 family metallopeptidase [Oscillospiraceae bacterium]|nr:M23 family metallopeptidase [Oscillospiraceae bacterium]
MKSKNKHKQSNYFTIMLVPDSSAKVRSIHISRRHFLLIWVLIFLCISIIISAISITPESVRHYPSVRIDGAMNEPSVAAENRYIQTPLRTQLYEFEQRIKELHYHSESIVYTKRNILNVFEALSAFDLPFSFDEALFSNSSPDWAYPNIHALAALNVTLYQKILGMQALAYYAEDLSSYFRYRPTGWPVDGRLIISGFGYRLSPSGERRIEQHDGIDISVPIGTAVFATAYGTVITAAWHPHGYGHFVAIEHRYGYSTLYAHNSELLVSTGDSVYRGQVIALSGNSGYSASPHLHYEVLFNNIPQNPLHFLVRD